jgi:hypothetical protein
MRLARPFAAIAAVLVAASSLHAQAIIAQTSGLANPNHLITFGANLYPNFTNITTQFPGITVVHARYFTTGVSNNIVGGFLTNDFSGAPNTLRITFSTIIHDLTFVYHQIGQTQPSVYRAVLAGATVFTFSNLSNQSQPNNYFGFTGIFFDELQIDFVSDFNIDTLAYNDIPASALIRNGTGINPVEYTASNLPVVGTTWLCSIVTNANTLATFVALAPGGPNPGIPFLNGEILVQLSPDPILVPGVGGAFSFAIPNVASLIGLPAATQGVRVDAVGPTQVIILLNALDLVLGV